MIYQKPKGTKDIFGRETRRVEKANTLARAFFGQNGYEEIKTPTFEFTELFSRSIGENTDIVEKEMYSFKVDERSYVLRPEGTASVLRAVIENKISIPARFLYIGTMFRKEKPQKGRYREFLQLGIENLGKAEPFYDAETIYLAREFLKLVGAVEFRIEVNSIGCPKCRIQYKTELKSYLEPKMNRLCADCQRRFEKNFLRIFDCKKESCQPVYQAAPMITDRLCPECGEHYVKVKNFLNLMGIEYAENKRLVRGLDYYTKTVFEFKSRALGAQDTLLAGGRYDLLMKELGGGDVPCIGWAMGQERMLLTLPENLPKIEDPKVFFIAVMGERFAQELLRLRITVIDHGFICFMGNPEAPIKHQMKDADRFGADHVIIYGENEEKEHYYTVKNMKSGEQVQVLKDNLDKFLTAVV